MTHEEIRSLLSAGESGTGIDEHLAGCAECAAWASTLARIRGAAPQAYAEAPAGLADRVLTAVRAAAPVAATSAAGAASVAAPPRAPGGDVVAFPWWRRTVVRAAVAAALVGAIAVGALTLPGSNGDTTLVAAAARKTAAADSARVEFTSSFSLTGGEPIPVPRLETRRLEHSIRRGVPRRLRGIFAGALRSLPDRTEPAPIREISSSVHGSGEVIFPDRLHLRGTITERHALGGEAGTFETIVIGERSYMRVPLFGDRWLALPAFPVDIQIAYHPGAALTYLGGYAGLETEAGVETLGGERVRHFRFTDEMSFGSYLGERSVRVDVYVGADDGLIRRIRERHTSDGRLGHLRSALDIRFFDLGADVTIEAPANVVTLDELAAGFFGFGFGLAAGALQFSFEMAASIPEIAFPRLRFDFPDFSFEGPDIRLPDFDFDFDFDVDVDVPSFDPPDFDFSGP